MKKLHYLLLLFLFACQKAIDQQALQMDNLYAWCIVPFDIKERSPTERMHMLKRIGFKKYVYDYREKHLPQMASEWELAKQNGIKVMGVWLWLDGRYDEVGQLNASGEKLFSALRQTKLHTQIWVSFNANYFSNLTDEEAVLKGAAMFDYLAQRADSINCKIKLYNHGDWFGEPDNQIKIIKALPQHDLQLVYNFHHAHKQLNDFPQLFNKMLPYLSSINLNGMKKGGPKILPIGKGDQEKQMIRLILDKGYKGSFGILGHVEDADVELILEENLRGLHAL